MSSPACRQAIACSCIAIADSTTIDLAGGVLVLRGGEGAVAHVVIELAGGGFDRLSEFGVLANELRDVIWVQSQEILDDQHLTIAVRPGPDTDRGHSQRLGDTLPERARDGLQHDCECAGVFQRPGVVEDPLGRFITATLDPIPAELVDEGWREPEVPHHWDPHGRELPGVVDDAPASL